MTKAVVLICTLVFAISCSEKKANESLSSESEVVPTSAYKTDRVIHGEQVANSLVVALGINNKNNIDDIYDRAREAQILLSESGQYDTVTGGYLNVVSEISEAACENLVYDQERGKLSIENGVVKDQRAYFRGVWLENNAPSGEAASLVNSDYEFTSKNYRTSYVQNIRYKNAIRRLGRTLWGRDIKQKEEDRIMALVETTLSGGASNKGYRAAIIICTVMASSFDFLRQ